MLSASLPAVMLVLLSVFSPQVAAVHHMQRAPSQWVERQSSGKPLVVTNMCSEDIYPGILTQAGTGPGSSGFRLIPGSQQSQTVSSNWQGRVWGRTNCSFNAAGTSAADGSGVACGSGDCGGTLDCEGAGVIPVTLAEFTLDAGGQTFYDISLVDGYNLPLGIVSLYPSSGNSTLEAIPPNLTNPVCIGTWSELAPPGSTADATLGTNSSYPLPLEESLTPEEVEQWCPWDLLLNIPAGSQSGVYTYPEGTLQRPAFDPCYSQCSKTGSPIDCCTGAYSSPTVCQPSIYSADAKTVCPDAYSYAFDDQTSTFIIPSGSGFEIVFCPPGRSTTILATYKQQLSQLAQGGLTIGTSSRLNPEAVETPETEIEVVLTDDGEHVPYTVLHEEDKGHRRLHQKRRFHA